ncbi:hypothetical protein [Legionella spiritensis]|uniref:Uncharacterized protein n=1 Tax=Legionella spiritensis TaxID=452 RepID=A0A0W0Z4L1_LEGSP|nr:hypothetical protein [Legionella spiritensis]KTD64089.1 hypothetical protein Lspi_1608 [Legionella spiritensis]SNV37719.1 Uncharacterised protein [Legionella spiritensis]
MSTEQSTIRFIKKELKSIYQSLDTPSKDLAIDILVNAVSSLEDKKFKVAYHHARQLYAIAGKPESEIIALFHNIFFAEDVATDNSVVLIHENSPYYESLAQLGEELGFTVQQHEFSSSCWTKDYVVSTGKDVVVPIKDKNRIDTYLTQEFVGRAQQNTSLYYGALNISEHHQAKVTISSPNKWITKSQPLLDHTDIVHKTALEGGNFFCAINKKGMRYYLLGENVVSETMAYNNLERDKAIDVITEELACPHDRLLIIPQWSYHLDLQMAYLGRGQFVIHSFHQKGINFGLPEESIDKIKITFAYLEKLFEKNVIDATCSILQEHDFEVDKVFGCLFYLEDTSDVNQKKWVPFCKADEDFEGAIALMMNGISLDLGARGRHFLTSKCDLPSFKEQYDVSLIKLGIDGVHDVDMPAYYDDDGYFDGMVTGFMGAGGVSDVAAAMNGGLRCQTSIVSKSLTTTYNPKGSRFRLFQSVDALDLNVTEEEPEVKNNPKKL